MSRLPEIRDALQHNFLFSSLSEEDLEALAAEVWLEEIPSGSLIVEEGDDADALYVVCAGGVNVLKASGQFLSYLGRNGFFGEMALFLDGATRSANCVAAVDTTCVVVRKDVLERFCLARPAAGLKLYRAIIRTLSERLQATSADLATLMRAQVKSQSSVSSIVERARQKRRASGADGGDASE